MVNETAVAADLPTGLHYEVHGRGGTPTLLMHGAGEDAEMLAPMATAVARTGATVIAYDRRGTGRSPRSGWPEGGVEQHVDDAAALITALGGGPLRVLGFSSGGVLALALAVRRPDLVTEAIAWEPAAVGVLPNADALHTMIMEPVEAHLQAHPRDWTGAYDVMLTSISGGRADLGDPQVAAMRRNAEAALRDDAAIITRHRFTAAELQTAPVTVAVGGGASELHAQIADVLSGLSGRRTWLVPGVDDHEVYLNHPAVLATAVGGRR